jgi:hypothetical protein
MLSKPVSTEFLERKSLKAHSGKGPIIIFCLTGKLWTAIRNPLMITQQSFGYLPPDKFTDRIPSFIS